MPRVTPPRRPPGPPPRPPRAPTLGEPRNLTDRPSSLRLATRRMRRRVRPALYGLAALATFGAGAAIWRASSHAASLTSLRERFGNAGALLGLKIHTVIVQGRVATPEPLLNAAIAAESGDPLLGYSVAAARGRITSLPSIEDATVERRWPATILVSLTERHAAAVWQNRDRFVLIDRDGQALADQDVRFAGELPLVVGAGAPSHAATLLDALATHPSITSHLVASVRVGDRRWNLTMTSGATVMLPEDSQNQALDRLDILQKDHQLLDRKLLVIDLRLPDRTTLRPAAAPPPIPDLTSSPRQPT